MATIAQPTGPLNKSALAAAVAAELGTTTHEGHRAVDAVLNAITRALAAGHSVTVTNFGSWRPVPRPARQARNPQTGELVTVPARQGIRVTTSPRLRDLVRTGAVTASIRKNPSR
ncbi:HU family DNA-binding protein [Streptomyces sp. NBC_00237]|uniref:HU family DNA-binding protein n=1 Tax=Streptomyces sp. NBC_00237 TaxID=2975687 RepID=UPI0022525E69|nr:HU family DNA-binding protein [Streptomyces sp. NBC_00237]MCX5201081.1 HU family DNA-binding protein [Streptomyces sp. NBC_00237]